MDLGADVQGAQGDGEMSKPYRPSNGTEGLMFQEQWCWRCVRDQAARDGRPEDGCSILADTMFYEKTDPRYPKEWVWDAEQLKRDGSLQIGGEGGARCTAFEAERS
jgi:hypothetical protein